MKRKEKKQKKQKIIITKKKRKEKKRKENSSSLLSIRAFKSDLPCLLHVQTNQEKPSASQFSVWFAYKSETQNSHSFITRVTAHDRNAFKQNKQKRISSSSHYYYTVTIIDCNDHCWYFSRSFSEPPSEIYLLSQLWFGHYYWVIRLCRY